MSKTQQQLDKINKRLEERQKETQQLENRKRVLESQQKAAQRKVENARKYRVGGIFLEYFPEFKQLEPKRTNALDYIEFAPLANFLSCLAAKADWVAQLKEESEVKTQTQLTEQADLPPAEESNQ